VFIELSAAILEGPVGNVDICTGMQAEIELEFCKRTVLECFLKTLFKASEAFTER
jgi:hypothetical protein